MGTSQSKPSAKGGSPLIPSWANQDPPPPGAAAPPATPPPHGQTPTPEVLQPRRNAGMRRALKQFYRTQDAGYARRALGHFARGSMAGGAGAAQRLARAARVGGAAFGALSNTVSGQQAVPGGFDLGSLSGRSIPDAIATIVDEFCPPGILDEDGIRAAMAEALAEAFSGLDKFDPANIDPHAVLVATRCFVAELVLAAVLAEQGQSAAGATPQQIVARENDIRDIVREITDVQATPILQQQGATLTPVQIEKLVGQIATAVYKEIASW